MAGALELGFGAWDYSHMPKIIITVLAMLALSLPVAAIAEETPKQHCDRVIADANKGQKQALAAGHLYRFGKWQNVKCVKVDYVLAVEFYAKAGAGYEIDQLLKELMYKVNAGSASAMSTMNRLEAKGYIRVEKIRQ